MLVVQVYCWLVDRLGGGWTLGFTNGYRWCHPNAGNTGTGNVDKNVLGTVKPLQLAAFGLRHSRRLHLLLCC